MCTKRIYAQTINSDLENQKKLNKDKNLHLQRGIPLGFSIHINPFHNSYKMNHTS